jgi:Glycosyl transferase family 2
MKISIIIPTRERAFYLEASIRTALDIDDPDIEVIVADNASTDETSDVISDLADPRLIYLPSDQRVSMRENFNRALYASSGDYLLFIGDDDAVITGQFQFLRRILEARKPDGISWFKATYGWPVGNFGNKTGGIRFYREDAFGAPVSYNPQDGIDALMHCRLGALDPTPAIYHGCVSRAFLDRIAPASGVYFDSMIPDVNFQYRSIYQGGNFLHTRHPFSINGYGPASTGGAHAATKPGSPSARIGTAFEAENKADPYVDIIDHALTVQLAFFATLETLRERSGLKAPVPSYTDWYQFALNATRMKPEHGARIESILNNYATRSGTMAQLETARGLAPRAKRTLPERLSRARSQLNSFRLSAEQDGENTVLSATRVYDAVLGNDYGAVLDNDLSPASAWRAAKRRAKGFTRQL